MKKLLASLLVMAMAVVLTLSSVLILVEAAIRISRISSPVLQGVATAGELFIGIVWLLGTVYLSTRLAVRIFRRGVSPRA